MSVRKLADLDCSVLIDVGCDWISYTVEPLVPAHRRAHVAVAKSIEWLQQHRQCVPRPRNMQGYQMMAYNHFMAGRNDEGRLRVQATSWFADRHLKHLQWLEGLNINRMDFQVTIQIDDHSYDLARGLYCAIPIAQAHLKRKTRLTFIESSDGGSTLYVGAPSSARRVRVYNKHAEDPNNFPPGCWRVEVQYRDEVARAAYEELAVPWDGGDANAIMALVQAQLDAWHVPLEVSRETHSGVKVGVCSEPESILRKINWLESDVAAACRNLANDGFGEEVYTILARIADSVYDVSCEIPKLALSSERWITDESVSD